MKSIKRFNLRGSSGENILIIKDSIKKFIHYHFLDSKGKSKLIKESTKYPLENLLYSNYLYNKKYITIMKPYYCLILHEGEFKSLKMGKSLVDKLMKKNEYSVRGFHVKIIVKERNITGSVIKLPDYSNSIVKTSTDDIPETYDSYKNYFENCFSSMKVWHDDSEYVRYLNDKGVDVNKFIMENRDKAINEILN